MPGMRMSDMITAGAPISLSFSSAAWPPAAVTAR